MHLLLTRLFFIAARDIRAGDISCTYAVHDLVPATDLEDGLEQALVVGKKIVLNGGLPEFVVAGLQGLQGLQGPPTRLALHCFFGSSSSGHSAAAVPVGLLGSLYQPGYGTL